MVFYEIATINVMILILIQSASSFLTNECRCMYVVHELVFGMHLCIFINQALFLISLSTQGYRYSSLQNRSYSSKVVKA